MTSLISNPPFNMKWKHPPFAQTHPRYIDSAVPPESNANYAFILTGLQLVDTKAVFILPTGILSTQNAQEAEIRKYLVETNLIESVISCPDKMFESTGIPVCIVVFNKKKKTAQVTMIDMRNTFELQQREQRGQYGGKSHENRVYKKEVKIFSTANMEKAISAIENKNNEAHFCKTISIEDIKNNDYILTPSRYIEFQGQEQKHREYKEIVSDINRTRREKNACKLTINETLARNLGFDLSLYAIEKDNSHLNDLLKKQGAEPLIKEDWFSTTKNKNEIRFENRSKDIVSSVLIMIMSMWKQHIFYLNREENRYLSELRDALIDDLMLQKIEI